MARDRRDRPRRARGRRRHARQRGQARGRGGVAPAGPRDDARCSCAGSAPRTSASSASRASTRCSWPSSGSWGSRPWPRGRSSPARSRWSRSSGRALVLAALVTAVAVASVPLAPAIAGRLGGGAVDGPVLALLVAWFALSGWGEFVGVALRCRRARRLEAGAAPRPARRSAGARRGGALPRGGPSGRRAGARASRPCPPSRSGRRLLRRTAPPVAGAVRVPRRGPPRVRSRWPSTGGCCC